MRSFFFHSTVSAHNAEYQIPSSISLVLSSGSRLPPHWRGYVSHSWLIHTLTVSVSSVGQDAVCRSSSYRATPFDWQHSQDMIDVIAAFMQEYHTFCFPPDDSQFGDRILAFLVIIYNGKSSSISFEVPAIEITFYILQFAFGIFLMAPEFIECFT